MDPMAAIRQTFFQECEEQLSELEGGLLSIEGGDHDPEIINAVFRAVHSIKGGASAFGFETLVEFVHVFETTLDLLRSNRLTPSASVVATLLKASDVLADLVRGTREGVDTDTDKVAEMQVALSGLCDECADPEGPTDNDEEGADSFDFKPLTIALDAIFSSEEDSQSVFDIIFRPKPSLYAKANEATLLLRELSQLGAMQADCDIANIPLLSELDPEGAYLTWKIRLKTEETFEKIQSVFEFVADDCELEITCASPAAESQSDSAAANLDCLAQEAETPQPQPAERAAVATKAKAESATPNQDEKEQPALQPQATIRVDLEKVDRLIDLVGELVINQAMLSQRVLEAGLTRASSVMIGLDELEQLTRDIQDSVMAIRAQPVKAVFQRMSRVVREVATLTKKSVRLVTEGESTEVDKTVIERLTDPLTHMIRNAVDHGIEAPEARIAAGKPEEGVLRLSATHRSGRIVIELTDDGAGINRPRVRSIAVTKGLIPPDAVLTEEEIDNLIFLPGFSTAQSASAISGRGVGMDVVKRAIQALRGRISITSQPGKGSTFSMSLPLTLAVLDGMVVTVAEQTFVVPLTTIIGTLQPRSADIHAAGPGVRVIRNRDCFVPVVDVGCVLRYRVTPVDPASQVALLTEAESGGRCALLVDAIQGQRQVVIKSLENNYGHVHGVAAATILGDGRVALIIDVDAIVKDLRKDYSSETPSQAAE